MKATKASTAGNDNMPPERALEEGDDGRASPPSSASASASASASPQLGSVSWIRQFRFTFKKNVLLVLRRPILLTMMLLSSVVSIIVGWLVARPPKSARFGPLNECGLVDASWWTQLRWNERDDIQLTQNDGFQSGIAVALFTLGPMMNAICTYIFIHEEFAGQLIGVLRALGLRDSVYWASWYSLFMIINCINAAFAVITAKTLPLHAFENIYGGGIFASLFFLHLALVPTSFLLATLLRHIKRGMIWIILIIMISLWIVPFVLNGQSELPNSPEQYSIPTSPRGLFWENRATVSYTQSSNFGACSEGDLYKTLVFCYLTPCSSVG